MTRPRLLDLFCCEGGAAVGYARAGFDVTGVDILPRFARRYPFEFHAAGIDWMTGHGRNQSVPPAYTEYVGRQILAHLDGSAL